MATGSWLFGAVEIRAVELGPFATNCYVVWERGKPECWLIDAGYEPGDLIEAARRNGLAPSLLLLTHAHPDHMAGVEQVRREFPGIRVLLHVAERDWLGDADLNLSSVIGLPVTARPADQLLHGGELLKLGESRWRVCHTPGHSPGGVSFVCTTQPVVFAGDTLFNSSIGRTDFPGSDFDTLDRSIRTQLYTLAPETLVLPGHGPSTTVGRERRSNPYVSG